MPEHIVWLVLMSALMHASWNVMIKRSPDGQLDTVCFALAGSLMMVPLLFLVPVPDLTCAPWMATSLFVHVAYFISLVEAYRRAELSVAYPLMRGMAPVFVSLMFIWAGESLSLMQVGGIWLVGAGIILSAWVSSSWRDESRKGIWIGCLNAFIIAMYTFLDGWGVRQSGTAIGYTSWLLFFNGWGILAYTQSRRGWMAVREHARLRWRISLLGASLSVGSYSIVLWAMSQASIPAVAALREVSVVIAAVMGTVWLRESMGLNRILGACMVCAGVMLIRLAGNA